MSRELAKIGQVLTATAALIGSWLILSSCGYAGQLVQGDPSLTWLNQSYYRILGINNAGFPPQCGEGLTDLRLWINSDYTAEYFNGMPMSACVAVAVFGEAQGIGSFARTKNNSGSAIGAISYAFADNPNTSNGAWANYGEGHRLVPNQYAYGFEYSAVNRVRGADCNITPYSATCAGTTGGQINCGNSYPASMMVEYGCTAGLTIQRNAGEGQVNLTGFQHGIFFTGDALDTTGHWPGWALSMGQGQALSWFAAAGNWLPTWQIYSAANGDYGGQIQLLDTQINFKPTIDAPNFFSVVNASGLPMFSINTDRPAVGVVTNTPAYPLDIGGPWLWGGALRLRGIGGSCVHTPNAGSETVTCSSARELKTAISEDEPSQIPYARSFALRSYTVRATGAAGFGPIADEVEPIHPEMVHVLEDGQQAVEQPSPWKLLRVIQELDQRISGLEAELKDLRKAD